MSRPLPVVRRLFRSLEEQNIRHAIWKGSQSLAEALAGEKDLDLLVGKGQDADLEKLLEELDFRRFESQPWARRSGVEDWIGIDAESGELVHVHLYRELIVGRRFVEEYRLPWEDALLDRAVRAEPLHVAVCDPNLEIILLGIRIAFLATGLDAPGTLVGRSRASERLWQKLCWFRGRVDEASVLPYAEELLGVGPGRELTSILLTEDTRRRRVLLRLRTIVLEALSPYRRFGRLRATQLYASRAVGAALARARRKLGLFSQTKKPMPGEGAIIAVIGSDGSGKSTVSQELVRWLRWKIDAHRIYLGSGDGSVSLPVRTLKRLASRTGRRRRAAPRSTTNGAGGRGPAKRSALRDVGAGVLALAIGEERLRKVRRAHRGRARGSILVTDRYPQMQFQGIYDGPRLVRGNGGSAVREFFAKLEERRYREIEQLPPDLVIRLHVPADVALGRKPDHDEDEVRRKAELTRRIDFPRAALVVDVDATTPLDEVLRSVKRTVWESI